MSRIAIISDVHANKHALELILKDIEKRNVDKIICLGDLVTKYFYPAEVVDAIKQNADIVLKGNCDNLVASDERYKFAREKLGLSRIEYLDSLPTQEQIKINKVLLSLYHSTPQDLQAMFNPIFSDNEHTKYKNNIITDYKDMFIGDKPQVSFVGHTHQDYVGVEQNNELIIKKDPIILDSNDRAIVNVGSAGEHNSLVPDNRGGYKVMIDPYLTYAIIDEKNLDNGFNTEIIRVPYTSELTKVYFDMVKRQEEKTAPYSPNDTKKVRDSLEQQAACLEQHDTQKESGHIVK